MAVSAGKSTAAQRLGGDLRAQSLNSSSSNRLVLLSPSIAQPFSWMLKTI